jgi:hypothetical protein
MSKPQSSKWQSWRVLAFEQRTSKQQIIEGWIADQLTKVERSYGAKLTPSNR